MPLRRACLFAVSLLVVPWTMHAPVHAERGSPRACIPITTPAEFDNVRAGMAGEYCLQNDIDMGAFGPFDPIGKVIKPFTGTFDGTGHVIRNLTVNAERQDIGLFGAISGGAVSNLTLAGVTITSARKTKSAGGIVGLLFGGGQVNNVHVTGRIECTSRLCRQGGIAGETLPGTAIADSSSAAFVAGGSGGAAGGAAGQIAGAIARTYATGSVSCRNNCAAGGLVGWMTDGNATDAFATGPVAARNESTLGGFAGYMGAALRAYSTGRVKVKHDSAAAAFAGYFAGATTETFATGRVNGRSDSLLGGFAAQLGENEPADSSYWDRQITRQTFSVRGAEQTTAGLQADLPLGFGSGWSITKGFSYPYLNLLDSGMFASTLATTVVNKRLYTFVPLSQREPTEYAGNPAHMDAASLAAVFAMVARAVGLTDDVAELQAVKIDQDFWKEAAQTATWAGPVTSHDSIGAGIAIVGATPIDDSNITGALKAHQVVAVRGSYAPDGGGSAKHWMLATLFTTDGVGNVTALVTNNPWTGTQVRIDPATKQVIFPVGFPLANFTVDGYRVITLNGGAT